jgi:zona occludens toxin
MAQTAYTGLPGSGKSYGVVKHVILPALEKGRRVWTNVPLKLSLLDDKYPGKITLFSIDDLLSDSDWFQNTFSPGATIVIDEAWRLWPQGLKANNMLQGHKSFLAEHRHMVGSDGLSTEIVLVTQDLSQLSTYPRNLTEFTYRAEKLSSVGQSNRYRIDIYRGAISGPNPPERLRTRQLFGKYEPDVYQYYTSQTMSEISEHGSETSTDSRTNILNSKFFKVGLPVLFLLGGIFIFYAMSSVKNMYSESEVETEEIAIREQIDLSAPPVPSSPPKQIKHFYDGMTAYIAYNNGQFPWIDFKIAFIDKTKRLVLKPEQLSKLGYSFVAFDPCFGQLTGFGQILNIFCDSPDIESNTTRPIIDL